MTPYFTRVQVTLYKVPETRPCTTSHPLLPGEPDGSYGVAVGGVVGLGRDTSSPLDAGRWHHHQAHGIRYWNEL